MNAQALLSRLDGVRRTGAGRWIGRCPAHDDRSPSLSLRELDDGRVLVHCFGGCAVHDVLASIGVGLADLFPARLTHECLSRERLPFDALSVLQCVTGDAWIVSVAADNLSHGIALTEPDRERLRVAAIRLHEAVELAHG